MTVEQRARALQEPQLQGGQAPAAHRRAGDAAERDGAAGGAAAEGAVGGAAAREALLARAESAGLLRKGTALTSRFVKAGALAPEAGGWTSAEAEAVRCACCTCCACCACRLAAYCCMCTTSKPSPYDLLSCAPHMRTLSLNHRRAAPWGERSHNTS